MKTTPFYLKPSAIEHDPALVRRFRWQSALRLWAGIGVVAVCVVLPLMALIASASAPMGGRSSAWPWWVMCNLFIGLLTPFMVMKSAVDQRLAELSEAGTPLSADMMSAQPQRVLNSPLDVLTTYNICTETLSGLALGMALGYGGPAVFSYSPFKGKILIGPRWPVWLTQCTEVLVVGEAGRPVEVRIRRRFGLDFFSVQRGGALLAVDTVSSHLRTQFELSERRLHAVEREKELQRAALEARLSALQAQVEPHFLFNTLANLKYLVRTDAEAAQRMLDHLVGYLQNTLPDMRSASSTVERELALVRDYLSIMRIRMGQRLSFRIDADAAALACALPPAMLISLVENAIKHGLERASRPGEIAISAALRDGELRVQVRDDGVGLTDHMGQGFGLANLHERLRLLYGEQASLSVEAAAAAGVIATLAIKEQACRWR